MQVAEVQRSRMLRSAVQLISEYGYGQMTVARVTRGARVSRRTFYDLFEDRDDCFLAAFDDAVERAAGVMVAGYERGRGWREGVRGALAGLLGFLDEEPAVCSLLIVDALGAGPRVLERRAEVLEGLSTVLQDGGSEAGSGRGVVPSLMGELLVGAVFSMMHTRLLRRYPGPMLELLNPLMSMIVSVYLGPAAARRELERPVVKPRASRVTGAIGAVMKDPLEGLDMRLTYRTLRTLGVVAERPGVSNRGVADHAGISDQGQVSKLLGRLERLGLVCNTGEGHLSGAPNAWRLTERGEEVQQAIRVPSKGTGGQENNGTGQ
jgi:AcrR family transcriptional regulator